MPEYTLKINKEIKINYINELYNLRPFLKSVKKELLHQTQNLKRFQIYFCEVKYNED